jgi:hypothetical protein
MSSLWPDKPFTFRALRKTFGAMWIRCDACRRYASLKIGGLEEVDYRSKTFSCSRCGAEAYLTLIEPVREAGMADYTLDPIDQPRRHHHATDRMLGRRRRRTVDLSGGDLPGRRVDPRR